MQGKFPFMLCKMENWITLCMHRMRKMWKYVGNLRILRNPMVNISRMHQK